MPAETETVSELARILTEDHLRRAMDTAIDGMIVIDSSGTVLLYNSACEQLFGYAADEVLGNNVKLLTTAQDRRNHDIYLRNYLRSGTARIIGVGRDVTGRRDKKERAGIEARIGSLTARERQVFEQLVMGRPNKVIACELEISPRTIEIYRRDVMSKMNADSLSHLVRMALVAGVDPLGDKARP